MLSPVWHACFNTHQLLGSELRDGFSAHVCVQITPNGCDGSEAGYRSNRVNRTAEVVYLSNERYN